MCIHLLCIISGWLACVYTWINGAKCIHTSIHCTLNTCCTSKCYIAAMLCSSQLWYCNLFCCNEVQHVSTVCHFQGKRWRRTIWMVVPTVLWCTWAQKIPDGIEHTTLCIECNDQPASCKVKSTFKACWECWCYSCFEQLDHQEEFDDVVIVDLNGPSDEYSDE